MRRLVVLRPEPGASATIERARAMGLDPLAMPLFKIEPVAWDPPDPKMFDALLLTSANALEFGGDGLDQLRALPVYAVGKATAAAAHRAGFEGAGFGDGGIERLLAAVPADLRLLHLCGQHRVPVDARQAMTELPVYRSVTLPPPDGFAQIAGQTVAVHSPRAGRRLAGLVDLAGIDRGTIRIAAISAAAADAAGPGWERVEAAATPDDAALLALAARLCDNPRNDMNATAPRSRLNWSARLLIGLMLIIAGAAAATWALARYNRAAHLLGVVPPQAAVAPQRAAAITPQTPESDAVEAAAVEARIAGLEARLGRVENAARRAEGSAGRTDALVVAFATRRAIDRGVPLGYLETLLVDRFGARHPRAVATIVTTSRTPVRLDELTADFEKLGPDLRAGGPGDNWLVKVQRELGSLIDIRRADRPSAKPDARYRRALSRLESGDVDAALAETMRMPGAARAGGWVNKARHYVAAHRALDEIESSALLASDSADR